MYKITDRIYYFVGAGGNIRREATIIAIDKAGVYSLISDYGNKFRLIENEIEGLCEWITDYFIRKEIKL